MAGVKLVVIYPRPTDVERFEKVYTEEHIPMAVEKLHGKTKIVATKVVGSPSGTPPFYRIAEIHFPSLDALNTCAASEEARATIAHAESISTGGRPIFLVAEEEILSFGATNDDQGLADCGDNLRSVSPESGPHFIAIRETCRTPSTLALIEM